MYILKIILASCTEEEYSTNLVVSKEKEKLIELKDNLEKEEDIIPILKSNNINQNTIKIIEGYLKDPYFDGYGFDLEIENIKEI